MAGAALTVLVKVDDEVLLALELGREFLGPDVAHRPLLALGRWFAVHIFLIAIIVSKLRRNFG